MKVNNFRFSENDLGYACGPMGEELIVELEVTDNQDGQHHFIFASTFDVGFRVVIAQTPLFDRMMSLDCSDNDFVQKHEAIEKNAEEIYDGEVSWAWGEDDYEDEDDEEDEEDYEDEEVFGFGPYENPDMMSSRFAPAIKLALKALAFSDNTEFSDDAAKQFISKYINRDTDELVIEL